MILMIECVICSATCWTSSHTVSTENLISFQYHGTHWICTCFLVLDFHLLRCPIALLIMESYRGKEIFCHSLLAPKLFSSLFSTVLSFAWNFTILSPLPHIFIIKLISWVVEYLIPSTRNIWSLFLWKTASRGHK